MPDEWTFDCLRPGLSIGFLDGYNTLSCAPALTLLCASQRRALGLLPAISLTCLTAPLQSLLLSCQDATQQRRAVITAAQLAPLRGLQQLCSLQISDVADFEHSLATTVRHLTALTRLVLAMRPRDHGASDPGGLFDAAGPLTRLEELSLTSGHGSTTIERLPDTMSRLVRLRQLEIREIRLMHSSQLTLLTTLETLVVDGGRPLEGFPQPHKPVPAGINALRSLQVLEVTCFYQHVPPLALPALTSLQLDAPSFSEVCPARAQACALLSCVAIFIPSTAVLLHALQPCIGPYIRLGPMPAPASTYMPAATVCQPRADWSQDDAWPWLARDLPKLRALRLFVPSTDTSTRWPAALPECTGLDTLMLGGSRACTIPRGRYLHQLAFAGHQYTGLPRFLRVATELEALMLATHPERMVDCSVLAALPNLAEIAFRGVEDTPSAADAVAKLQQRLPGVEVLLGSQDSGGGLDTAAGTHRGMSLGS